VSTVTISKRLPSLKSREQWTTTYCPREVGAQFKKRRREKQMIQAGGTYSGLYVVSEGNFTCREKETSPDRRRNGVIFKNCLHGGRTFVS